MDIDGAIQDLSQSLRKRDSDLYVFQPDDVEDRFFLSAAALSAAATVLLTAFFKGFSKGLETKVEEWGEELANWTANQLKMLFQSSEKLPSPDLAEGAAAQAKSDAKGAEAARMTTCSDGVEEVLADTLVSRGVLRANAIQISADVRKSAEAVLRGPD